MMGGDLREAADLPFSGNRLAFVYTEPDSAYSVVEWVAAPGAPGTPLHLHRATDEAFYVLEGTLGFQVGQRTLELIPFRFVGGIMSTCQRYSLHKLSRKTPKSLRSSKSTIATPTCSSA
ncbi:MAG: cupin domain-containing protein [Actinomycetota bacterium]|nr:cupin domain-containing protein [Actinomycetota bacterium]